MNKIPHTFAEDLSKDLDVPLAFAEDAMNIVEDSGQRRTLVFDSIVVNAPIPEDELIFRVPRGTRIVSDLDSKF